MGIEIISLLFLVVAIFIGFKKNINTGILGIAFAVLLGFFVQIDISKDPEVVKMVALSSSAAKGSAFISGFDTKLFFILLGMTFLFCIAQVNGTLEILARKAAALTRGNNKLLPILFFIFAAVFSALGPGNIAMCALLLPIAMAVAKEQKIPPVLMAAMVVMGAQAGALSPIAPTGIINTQLTENLGLDTTREVFFSMIKANALYALALYFILGGWKLKKTEVVKGQQEDKFTKIHWLTLGVIVGVVVGIIFFKLNIGMVAFLGAGLLLILGVAEQKKVFAAIPWPTLLLVVGVGMLVNVITLAGGIDFLTDTLSSLMNSITAAPIIGSVAGLMSFVSSASGVVMPTLIPTTTGLVQEIGGGLTPQLLISAIVFGAHVVAISPLSTLGALGVATVSDQQEADKLFRQLLIIGVAGVIVTPVLVLLGIMG